MSTLTIILLVLFIAFIIALCFKQTRDVIWPVVEFILEIILIFKK